MGDSTPRFEEAIVINRQWNEWLLNDVKEDGENGGLSDCEDVACWETTVNVMEKIDVGLGGKGWRIAWDGDKLGDGTFRLQK